jgi:two-component system sensor histidine kinase QseC
LNAVFSSLLHVAVERSGPGGEVRIAAEHLEPHIVISISDSGPPLSPAEVTRLFDPEFRVTGRLVTTGDWNLFAARRLVQQSGGDIRAAGSTFVVTLPCPAA